MIENLKILENWAILYTKQANMIVAVNIRLYEYWHKQVKIRKKEMKFYNNEIKKFYSK